MYNLILLKNDQKNIQTEEKEEGNHPRVPGAQENKRRTKDRAAPPPLREGASRRIIPCFRVEKGFRGRYSLRRLRAPAACPPQTSLSSFPMRREGMPLSYQKKRPACRPHGTESSAGYPQRSAACPFRSLPRSSFFLNHPRVV